MTGFSLIGPDDALFLKGMLYEMVFFTDMSKKPSEEELLAIPEIYRYFGLIAGHGSGLIAKVDGTNAGAAWYIDFPAPQKGYGFVKYGIPELSIAVAEKYRGKGIGRQLMDKLIALTRKNGYPGISLSVDVVNPARILYEKLGFESVEINGASQTMVLYFDKSKWARQG